MKSKSLTKTFIKFSITSVREQLSLFTLIPITTTQDFVIFILPTLVRSNCFEYFVNAFEPDHRGILLDYSAAHKYLILSDLANLRLVGGYKEGGFKIRSITF